MADSECNPTRTCCRCGASIHSGRSDRVFCSKRCAKATDYARHKSEISSRRRASYRKRLWSYPQRSCAGCGSTFQPKRSDTRYCSEPCWWKCFRASQHRREAQRGSNRKRESVKKGASSAEHVVPRIVFERDGWKCGLCGRPTPRQLVGLRKSQSPTMDHIVPLSAGGAHSYQNIQCACWRCNHKKAARTKGQFRLF
jgi:5-methylcytosine-specific restriction endonuclease McrA